MCDFSRFGVAETEHDLARRGPDDVVLPPIEVRTLVHGDQFKLCFGKAARQGRYREIEIPGAFPGGEGIDVRAEFVAGILSGEAISSDAVNARVQQPVFVVHDAEGAEATVENVGTAVDRGLSRELPRSGRISATGQDVGQTRFAVEPVRHDRARPTRVGDGDTGRLCLPKKTVVVEVHQGRRVPRQGRRSQFPDMVDSVVKPEMPVVGPDLARSVGDESSFRGIITAELGTDRGCTENAEQCRHRRIETGRTVR